MQMTRYLQVFFLTFLFLFSAQTFAVTKAKSAPLSDTVITGKIKAKIALDPGISVFNVDVSTDHRIVSLAGVVNSDTDAGALIEIAQSTDGVKDVEISKLEVKNSNQPFTDTVITAKVKGVLIREKLFGKDVPAVDIAVETNNGIVYLSGRVDSTQQANNAINLAKSVDGVKQVESRIKITKKIVRR